MGGYLSQFDGAVSMNVASMVGHGTVRWNVLGTSSAPASRRDLYDMGALIEEAFEEGAGTSPTVSSYVPGCFANREELNYVGTLVRRLGGAVVYHIRNEADFALESLEEVLQVARDTGVRTHVSHYKVTGAANWHKAEASMEAMEKALSEGLDVTFEQYPYPSGNTMMSAVLPPWVLEGSTAEVLARLADPMLRERIRHDVENGVERWQSFGAIAAWNIVCSSVGSDRNRDKVGLNLRDLAVEAGTTPLEVAIGLLLEEELNVGMIIFHQSEDVLRQFMRHPRGGFGTDGVIGQRPHPRMYGTFPRVLGHYVRDEKVLRMEEAIRKSTSVAADRLRLADRGRIAGAWRPTSWCSIPTPWRTQPPSKTRASTRPASTGC